MPISNETAARFTVQEADMDGSSNVNVDEFLSFVWTIFPKTQMKVSAAVQHSAAVFEWN
jgi:hypothetical protein